MGVIEFELQRTIKAPTEDVFARLADINGHNEWMPKKGSILRHTHQTSHGKPTLGTRFLDETVYGPTPGKSWSSKHRTRWSTTGGTARSPASSRPEGWPGYSLESEDDNTTLVRHHAKMHTFRPYRLATPILRRIAVKERTTTVDALKASFETTG